MTSNLIFENFKKLIVNPCNLKIIEWFPNGKNSIRIILQNKQTLVFNYNTDDDWQIETIKRFINKMKEGKF